MIDNLPQMEAITCTFNTTEDCNLRCKYCYETNKTSKKLKIEDAKKFIDLILSEITLDKDPFNYKGTDFECFYDGLILDFIGGDSLVSPNILDEILTYFNYKFNFISDKYPRGWRASISSNGTLFDHKDVRDFCEKWKEVLNLSVSLDGCPELHNKNRVFPNGNGSFDSILAGWDWYKSTFPILAQQTKATWSKDSIPYIYDSLVYLYEKMGIKYINANFIMEDTGATSEDFKELDKQLEKCMYYVLYHRHDLYFRPFDRVQFTRNSLKFSSKEDFLTKSWCGSGGMPCLSIDGSIYPCFRWLPASQNGKEDIMKVGDVNHGFTHIENFKKVLDGAIRNNCTKDEKCRTCEFEPGCSYCIAGCYAEHGDFIRNTYICEYTKLQYKWAEEYWRKYDELERVSR